MKGAILASTPGDAIIKERSPDYTAPESVHNPTASQPAERAVPRLNNEQLKDWALPHSTNSKGDCAGVTKFLIEESFARFNGEPPTSRKKKAVRLEGVEKTSHIGILLRWDNTDEEIIVDATIQQFGGTERVFVGSYDDWVDQLLALTHCTKATPVDAEFGGTYDVLDFLDELSATRANAERRNSDIASNETMKAETLKKGCGCTLL